MRVALCSKGSVKMSKYFLLIAVTLVGITLYRSPPSLEYEVVVLERETRDTQKDIEDFFKKSIPA